VNNLNYDPGWWKHEKALSLQRKKSARNHPQ
jgi:hypothetical protein